ncbi:hypothetical protein L21SP3_02180 [Sedimentisphaera cyanobacteriorum]|uniref:Uncharacterized protein n=1 Tax=Sedimentisphaera cyanobacteriorum TaxID=1940790 RepID=A0A1Q2HSC5_9BACT|nr:hypothetical protein [Sedimentisphaera cyanobacteriorum]AQQ10348.1 hypothetical protein L21SP3_02180 [Sedimentisphaera cyanobacteriorum]
MKKAIIVIFLASAITVLSGCGKGLGMTAAERQREYMNIQDVGAKQLNDDINVLLHSDRPSRLTDKYIR